MDKTLRLLLFSGILLCLLQVWIPRYFLTGDGPCHVYNSGILHHLWKGEDTGFYKSFYRTGELRPDPNWSGHIVMAALMFVVNGVAAEKILLSLYIILAITGFYKLLSLRKKNNYIAIGVLLFVFNVPLLKGFYNFTLSLAFSFWAIWACVHFVQRKTISRFLLVVLFAGLGFFSHALGFIYSLVLGLCLAGSYGLYKTAGEPIQKLVAAVKNMLWLLVAYSPFLILLWKYMAGHDTGIFVHFYTVRVIDLFHLYALVTHHPGEAKVTVVIMPLLITLVLLSLILPAVRGKTKEYSGAWLAVIVFLLIYFFLPDWMFGGGMFAMRAEILAAITICLCAGFSSLPRIVNKTAGIIFFVLFLVLGIMRMPVILSAAEAETDYMLVRDKMKPYSVVLPLSFAHAGETPRRQPVSYCSWLFPHASDYLGVYKPLIMLDNYEANTGYFPLVWQSHRNPYTHLDRPPGMEDQRPGADIDNYRKIGGTDIDYIIFWCYDTSFCEVRNVAGLVGKVRREYTQVYATPTGRTILFERKRQPASPYDTLR